MRSSAVPAPLGVLLIGALLLTPIQAAQADDADEEIEASFRRPVRTSDNLEEWDRLTQEWYEDQLNRAFERLRPKPDRQVLLGVSEDPRQGRGFIRGRFRVNLKRGLEYRQDLTLGDQRVRLKLYGPIVKGNPGLRLKLNGLKLRDREVEIEAFGNPEKGGLEVKIEF